MSIPGSANPLLFASVAAEAAGYQIERSVRFNSSDSAYLSRTPASAGNRKTWTWSGWVKRSKIGTSQRIFTVNTQSNFENAIYFMFLSDKLESRSTSSGSNQFFFRTNAVFRDPSAWYHIVFYMDTTQATASDRFRLYVNNEEQTFESGSLVYPSQNLDLNGVNTATSHLIGTLGYSPTSFLDAYLADVHFIDGQALDPTSFGEYDDNGIWQPIEYTGSFGTNGFHLPFDDNSTAAALGTDTSGNSNDWTVNNISVTAGAGNDSLVDVPTNGTETDTGVGGEVRGNYATLNPLMTGNGSYSNGNLDSNFTSGSTVGFGQRQWGSIGVSSGKWYFEYVQTSGNIQGVGIKSTITADNLNGYAYVAGALKLDASGSTSSYGASIAVNDVVGVAFDLDAGTITFYLNGVSQGQAFSGITAGTYLPYLLGWSGGNSTQTVNFGQRPFAYTAPSGFKALCTTNLPDPTIADGSTVFDVRSGLTAQFTISDLNFAADLVVAKSTSNSEYWIVADVVRSFIGGLRFNDTNAESSGNAITSVGATGYQSDSNWFTTGGTYVTYNWDAGTSTVSNTDGSITSSVRANPSAGFSIVTYSGNSTSGATIGHGLNAAPEFVVVKARNTTQGWCVYHSALGATKYIQLDTTSGASTYSGTWNNTAPTNSVFTVGNDNIVNTGYNYVAYCFAPVDGYSSFGSYVGNGSSDGPFVFTGFRPRWLLIKESSGADAWHLLDSARLGYNDDNAELYPNTSAAEANNSRLDFLSNGFKLRTSFTSTNQSGATYIYAAFGDPFKTARAR